MMKSILVAPLVVASFLTWPSTKERPVDGFELRGSASALDDDCIALTPDVRWASGSAWSKTPLDLDQPFDIRLGLGFGDKDQLGADGIVFALAGDRRTGYRGEGLGYAGLRGSIGLELDTYQNHRQGDPAADHLALLVDGSPYHHHRSSVVPLPNLEDGRRHALRVVWSPSADTLEVFVDGTRAATYPGALVREVLGSASPVSWGLTAGTGRKTNAHVACLDQP